MSANGNNPHDQAHDQAQVQASQQCVGFYTWMSELDEDCYVELYSNAWLDA